MKKLLIMGFTYACILFLTASAYCQSNSPMTQSFCSPSSQADGYYIPTAQEEYFISRRTKTINLYFHILSTDTHNKISDQRVESFFNYLNEFFCPFNIQFQTGDFIYNYIPPNSDGVSLESFERGTPNYSTDPVSAATTGTIKELEYLYEDITDGIHILIMPNFNNNLDPSGRVSRIADNSSLYGEIETPVIGLSVAEITANSNLNAYTMSVVAHEMAHALGLFHTFKGDERIKQIYNSVGSQNAIENYFGCSELVDGSNSLSCGDFIEDTPASPMLMFGSPNYPPLSECNTLNSSCQYESSCNDLFDPAGQEYDPLVNNLMSYSMYMDYNLSSGWPITYCDNNLLTPGQISRMHYKISTVPALIECVVDELFDDRLVESSKLVVE